MTDPFRIATHDELWLRGRLVERRLSHGEAIEDEQGILASDVRDDALVAVCERELARMHDVMPRDARVRLVATASSDEVASTMTIGLRGLSVVTSPEHAQEDYELLRAIASVEPEGDAVDYRGIPMIWRNGSAAVLLHEAIGHAAEHDHAPIEWPPWLHVDVPLRMRRETFRDVPLLRMTNLVAQVESGRPARPPGAGGTPALHPDSIEILLVAGGSYEPLTQTVTLRVAAANHAGRRLPPFEIRASREDVARALLGAEGEPLRYPGVVCSREGQELIVGSYAPVMMTLFR
ncbi:MAG TPA: hypothetical protein VKB93_08400 [Thermoanaerobaculia bacterium]|nr:hypothetical protein [Thermoanaerobaculia bacterium]